ncbi:MAG: hypothetical protein QOH81_2007 [Sphingomonadales bacterium]|jgi:hypothetical protein|nr:hypothetical protein [Sphingomonadales bacterium]
MTATAAASRQDRVDASLSALLVVQFLTLFAAIPLSALDPAGHLLLDLCHLGFAALCVGVLTRHGGVRTALLVCLALLALGPAGDGWLSARLGISTWRMHDVIALTAFCFNGLVTALVARHVFAAGRVNVHRIQGAVLLYLNAAAMFTIAYGMIATHVPGAFVPATGPPLPAAQGARMASLSYFSLETITTAGYGDLVPVHPFARSLANLEAVFGQLFPATLLARLVGLHLAGRRDRSEGEGA